MIDLDVIDDIIDSAESRISDILPSEWAEENRFLSSEVTDIQGMYSFDNSPYAREPLDCLHPSHPARVIVIKKGVQLGLSMGFIENGIGWIMSENPGNIVALLGHDDLVEKSGTRIESMIDNSGLRPLIRDTAMRAKNNKSGDKDRMKTFPGGFLSLGPTNHKTLRQVSYKYGFIDDFEAMKGSTKESGDTVSMIKARFTASGKSYKLCFISTPELEEDSNIDGEYLKGDQRKWHIPCPCCDQMIVLEWECDSIIHEGEKAGITWRLDENNRLIPDSVGYVCQSCGEFFDDTGKSDWLRRGDFIPTAIPEDPDYVSFHVSSLNAPVYMFGWKHYVQQYLTNNPVGQPRDETAHQTFVNLVLGECYSPKGEGIDPGKLAGNTRPYNAFIIPNKLSQRDGNGKIRLVTLACDLNGTAEGEYKATECDARIDWEIVAWSENGSSYSVAEGSIGTFQPSGVRDPSYHDHPDRIRWSYKWGTEHCVWDELSRIISTPIDTDTGGTMPIMASGIDTGYLQHYAMHFVEQTDLCFGIKGDKLQNIGIEIAADYKPFKPSSEVSGQWIVNVNKYKDIIATYASKVWNPHVSPDQPPGFMNFPETEKDRYTKKHFFDHFESEAKVFDENKKRFTWKKVSHNAQNHKWDCRVYNIAVRDIFVHEAMTEMKNKKKGWSDYVALLAGNKNG